MTSDALPYPIALKTSTTPQAFEKTLHTIAHDIRSPIRNILTFSTFLDKDNPSLSSDSKDHILEIQKAAKSLETLLQGLLQVGHNWTTPPHFQLASLQEIVSTAMNNETLTNSDISIQADLPNLICDAEKISTLFKILISNAIKFRAQDKPSIQIGSTTIDQETAFFVRDNGIGIPEKNHLEIGTLFRQLHPKSQYTGHGVGLYIAKQIITVHRGKMYLQSTPGEGTTIYFTIPQEQEIFS